MTADVKMPRRDLIDAAAEIARKRIAPIVILTGVQPTGVGGTSGDAGAMAYLVKPFNVTDSYRRSRWWSAGSRRRCTETGVVTLSDQLTRKPVERQGFAAGHHQMTEPEAFADPAPRWTAARHDEARCRGGAETLDQPKDALQKEAVIGWRQQHQGLMP